MSPIDAFTEALYRAGAPYDREGDLVTVRGHHVYLRGLTSLPEGVTFSNGGYVDLRGLTSLPEGVTFSNGGYVDLSGLTSLPEGVTFSNGGDVYLSGLTSLPEGVTFSNGGDVDLRGLTSLPEGVTFSNGGYVDLSGLTSLPEGVTFSNGGYVDLSGLTSLPEGVTFSNGGGVDLRGLTDELQTYQGKQIRLRNVDGYTMLILSERVSGGITISHTAYFRGGDLDKMKRSYVAAQGGYSAHGETIEKALRDLRFKQMEHDFDQDELVAEIRERGTVHINDFRLITGACESGTREGMAAAGLDRDADELPLDAVLAAVHGSYGAQFKALFEKVAA